MLGACGGALRQLCTKRAVWKTSLSTTTQRSAERYVRRQLHFSEIHYIYDTVRINRSRSLLKLMIVDRSARDLEPESYRAHAREPAARLVSAVGAPIVAPWCADKLHLNNERGGSGWADEEGEADAVVSSAGQRAAHDAASSHTPRAVGSSSPHARTRPREDV